MGQKEFGINFSTRRTCPAIQTFRIASGRRKLEIPTAWMESRTAPPPNIKNNRESKWMEFISTSYIRSEMSGIRASTPIACRLGTTTRMKRRMKRDGGHLSLHLHSDQIQILWILCLPSNRSSWIYSILQYQDLIHNTDHFTWSGFSSALSLLYLICMPMKNVSRFRDLLASPFRCI